MLVVLWEKIGSIEFLAELVYFSQNVFNLSKHPAPYKFQVCMFVLLHVSNLLHKEYCDENDKLVIDESGVSRLPQRDNSYLM